MASRSVYLAKSGAKSMRAHFGIFIPNLVHNSNTLGADSSSGPCVGTVVHLVGTVIHVVGEPLMAGYAVEFKRNFDCSSTVSLLRELVLLGYIDEQYLYEPATPQSYEESVPRSRIETIATRVPPPPRGQDIRAPIDGVTTKRCQEWTMEFLQELVRQGLLHDNALGIAQEERDPPTFGIFGLGRTA